MIVDPEHNNTMVSGSLKFSRFSVFNEMVIFRQQKHHWRTLPLMTLLWKVQGKVSNYLNLSHCHKLNHALELGASPPNPKHTQSALDAKHPPLLELPPNQGYVVGPSHSTQPGYIQSPTIYHYTNPTTQQQVASLLPPDHPEMICLQAGAHVPHARYGILG